jgi:ribosomal protein S18 acetylase RimI-like enzyme
MFDTRWMIIEDLPKVMFMSVNLLRRNPRNTMQAIQRLDNYAVMVLERHREVVGYMLYKHHGDIVKIRQICVMPDYRRKGGGTAMLQGLIEGYSKAEKPKPIEVTLPEDNFNTQSFLRKLGFKASGIKKEVFKKGDGYVFRYNFGQNAIKEKT